MTPGRRPLAWVGSRDRASIAIPVGLLLAGLIATLYRIGSKSIWYDESLSVRHATSGLDPFLADVVGRDTNGILYFLILRPWILVFGEGEGAIRALSAGFAVATVLLVYAIGGRLLGRWGGLAAAVLLLASRMTVEYAQEARAYSMAMAIATLGTWLVLELAASNAAWRRVGYAALMGLGVYTHLFVGFVFAAHLSWLALRAARAAPDISWRHVIEIVIVFSLVAAPMALFAVLGNGPDWVRPLSSDTLTWTFLGLAGDSWALVAVALVAVGIAVVHLLRHRDRSDPRVGALELVLLWAVVPIALGVAISVVRSMLVTRYFLVTLPAFSLLVVFACSRLRWRPAAVVAYGLVLVLSLVPTIDWYTAPSRANWRNLTQDVAVASDPGDRVAFYERHQQSTFDYYVRRFGLADEAPTLLAPGDLAAIASSTDPSARPARIWLVLSYQYTGVTPPALATMLDELEAAGYRPSGKDRTFGAVRFRLMVDEGRPAAP